MHRTVLPFDPGSGIAIKREVHEIVVAAPARPFIDSLTQVLLDPERRYGLIRVMFPPGLAAGELRPGVRFQGRYELELAAGEIDGPLRRPLQLLCGAPWVRAALGRVGDAVISNYAELTELQLDPAPVARMKYVYLRGTPIAGSSTYLIRPLADEMCCFTQVFEYQEINRLAHATFGTFGLRHHDRAVYAQVHHAARRLGARVVSTTLPAAYCRV
jgi:hypothetical protein